MKNQNSTKKISLIALSSIFISIGILHFIFDEFLLTIIPPILPEKLLLVYLSGLIEICFGILICLPHLRRIIAWLMILHLIAVFPANIYMYTNREFFAYIPEWLLLLRLPLQLVFILWAYSFTKSKDNNLLN